MLKTKLGDLRNRKRKAITGDALFFYIFFLLYVYTQHLKKLKGKFVIFIWANYLQNLLYYQFYKMSVERCLFCNSAAHTMAKCNSNFGGQRKQIDDLWRFLVQDTCPDFNAYPLNQLRYIAYHFARYEKAIPLKRGSMGHKYNRKYLLNPISLTLSKPRIVNALVERWTGFQSVRDLRSSVPEGDSCPICIETPLTVPKWDLEHSKWDMEYCITRDDDLLIVTKCKHLFCGSCWNAHLGTNMRRDNLGEYVSCPMCRSRIKCTRNHVTA